MNITQTPYRMSPAMSSYYINNSPPNTDFRYLESSRPYEMNPSATAVRALMYNQSPTQSQTLMQHQSDLQQHHSPSLYTTAPSENFSQDQRNNNNNNMAASVNNNYEPSTCDNYNDYTLADSADANFKSDPDLEMNYQPGNYPQQERSLYHQMQPEQCHQAYQQHHSISAYQRPQTQNTATPTNRMQHGHHHPHHHHASDNTVAGHLQHYQHSHRHIEHATSSEEDALASGSELWTDSQIETSEEEKQSNALLLSNR